MRRVLAFAWRYRVMVAWVLVSLLNAALFAGIVTAIQENRHTAVTAAHTAATAKHAAADARAAIRRVKREGLKRRDQLCLADENAHLRDVKKLRATYRFLLGPPPPAPSSLVLAVRLGLSSQEADARDHAPDFCDEPGIGLPEPDPIIPRRPKALR